MKKSTKKFLGFAIPTTILGVVARKAYVDIRYGEKGPKPLITFSESTDAKLDEIHLTAHRGLSSIVPENTIEAFKEAAKHNYYALECDVHCTTDNKWVIIHDYMLQSMAKEKGDVKKMSYEALSKIKFTKGANIEDYPNSTVCLVEDFIEICKNANIRPMIEVKDRRVEKVADLLEIIRKYDIEKDVIIISFHKNVLRQFKALSPDIELWYLVHTITNEKLLESVEYGFGVAFEAKRNMDKPHMIQNIHDNNLKAACWTVDNKEMLNKMISNGVKYITTNAIIPE